MGISLASGAAGGLGIDRLLSRWRAKRTKSN